MKSKLNILLEQEALSQNDPIFGTNQGASRFQYKAFRDQITKRLKSAFGRGLSAPEERKAFKFIRNWGPNKSQFDEANLIGGFKPIVDSMIKAGLIFDDNPDFFKAYYFQRKSISGFGYIQIIELDPQEELKTAFEKLAETFEVSEDTLLRIAKETELIKKDFK